MRLQWRSAAALCFASTVLHVQAQEHRNTADVKSLTVTGSYIKGLILQGAQPLTIIRRWATLQTFWRI